MRELTLTELIRSVFILSVSGSLDVRIRNLTHDSRRVEPGSLFFALPGTKTDGSLFVNEAIQKGACAIISERPKPPGLKVSWVEVKNITEAMGQIANSFFRSPSLSMTLFGVTGTNGKTTVTYFLESILNSCGARPAVIGTISYRGPGVPPVKAINTTPLSIEILALLARLRDSGTTHVAMEVSSHALALKRVEELDFDAAIFTNLKRDHLDFHKTADNYFKAKSHLFELLEKSQKENRVAVINRDDLRAQELNLLIKKPQKIFYGLTDGAGLSIEELHCDLNGSKFIMRYNGRKIPASIRLLGRYNVSNALAAAGTALEIGLPEKEIVSGLHNLSFVPGRLEEVASNKPFKVFIDFAHTDSALESTLSSLREISQGRIITVFGCGGERDSTKRGPMGIAAVTLSDFAIVTNDNPRGEDPIAIFNDIQNGINQTGLKNYKIISNRSQAITEAIGLAQSGDTVLIAGKGHENYQIIKNETIPFSDREVAINALKNLP